MANPVGRPSLYDPSFCEAVVECLKDGNSLVHFAADIGVCRETIQEWRRVHPDFSVACKKAMALAQTYWEKTLKEFVCQSSKDVNTTALIFLMKSRFQDYKENRPQDERAQEKYEVPESLQVDA